VGKAAEAITALKHLLEVSPTDAEAWSELADMYLSQGIYIHAIFSLEEALVLMPSAWNVWRSFRDTGVVANSV
jgi:ER membrane protein complex subunit 2